MCDNFCSKAKNTRKENDKAVTKPTKLTDHDGNKCVLNLNKLWAFYSIVLFAGKCRIFTLLNTGFTRQL